MRLELLSAATKLFFKRPAEMQHMLGRLLEAAIAGEPPPPLPTHPPIPTYDHLLTHDRPHRHHFIHVLDLTPNLTPAPTPTPTLTISPKQTRASLTCTTAR